MNKRVIAIFILLSLSLILSFYIRFCGAEFGLPILTHFDEPYIVDNALKMIERESTNPRFFNYPSLYIYAQSLLYIGMSSIGSVFGNPIDLSNFENPTLYYAGRLMTVVLSMGTILILFVAARRLLGTVAGILTTLFVGLSFLHVKNSFYITVDSPMTFWVVCSFFIATSIYLNRATFLHYVLAGVFTGLAASTKYTGILCVLPVIYAHLYSKRFNVKSMMDIRFIVCLALVPVAFLVTTPYAILDYDTFIQHVAAERNHYIKGHVGSSSSGNHSFDYYLSILLEEFGVAQMVLAGLGLIAIAIKSPSKAVLVVLMPALFFLFVGQYKTHFSRNILAAIPFLSIFAAGAVATALEFATKNYQAFKERQGSKDKKYLMPKLVASLLLLTLFVSAGGYGLYEQGNQSITHVRKITLPDTRWLSTIWINDNLPEGSVIALEHYTPRPDRDKFELMMLGKYGLLRRDRRFERSDYFVASSSDYKRFFREPKKHKRHVSKYKRIFSTYKEIKTFSSQSGKTTGPTIRIFTTKTDPTN